MKGNPTLNDVTEMADVSIATVSRVLSQNGYVSSENRLKIEAAITKPGYRGRSSNKTFKRKKSRLIAIITSTSRVHTFLPRLTYALSIAANQAGYFTLGIHRSADNGRIHICNSMAREDCYMELEKIFKRGPAPDGVVVWSDVFGIAAMQYFNKHKIIINDINIFYLLFRYPLVK